MLFLMNCLAACLHGPGQKGSIFYGAMGLVFASAGLTQAWRQVLVESNSLEQLPDCIAHLKGTDSWWDAVHRMPDGASDRSEERRAGNEGVSKCRYRWSP